MWGWTATLALLRLLYLLLVMPQHILGNTASVQAWAGSAAVDATLGLLHTLFLALWLLPVYCVSFALSCVWCAPRPAYLPWRAGPVLA